MVSLCNRRDIGNCRAIQTATLNLRRKDVKWDWNSDCEGAFKALKAALCAAPVLAYPTRDDPFILDTDASNDGIGAVLSQKQNGVERVICFG
jgi:hypothetical protein